MTTFATAFSDEVYLPTEPLASNPPGRWLSVVPHLDPKYGGLSSIVPQLCSAVSAIGEVPAGIAAFCSSEEARQLQIQPEISSSFWPASRSEWWRDKDLSRRFRDLVQGADGLHIHGLWETSTNVAASAARSLGKPYMISAHGMLEPWALANKKWKKRIYSALVERANLNGASCLHALTRAEAEDYRGFGCTQPIAVIPNAVQVPGVLREDRFLARFPRLRGRRIVLFLGRIHYKKGLDILIRSWAAVAKAWPEACLVLAGPDFEGTRHAVEQLISSYGLGEQTLFTGMLDSEMKWSALAAAQCFVLPSYSEGLSTSVLEAMGAGLPVIVTENCNIPEVSEHRAGWEIPANIEQLTCVMAEFLENSTAENKKIGQKGKSLVQERYSWPMVACQMTEIYRWMAGGPRPHSAHVMVN